jgi:pyruvate ferredoxin oxidoreductase gamma subunit
MKGITEIRWHGRGGQGVKTAALLFGDAALGEGLYIQAFPEYGPERMGAPVQSFNRLSDKPIVIHCGITNPHVVVVLDATLMGKVDVSAGLSKEGKLIVNSADPPAEIRHKLGLSGVKVFTIDASKISRETIGRDIPNTPMLGALVKVTELIPFEKMLKDTEEKLKKKFASKPEVVEGNISAIRRAYQEVKSE